MSLLNIADKLLKFAVFIGNLNQRMFRWYRRLEPRDFAIISVPYSRLQLWRGI